MCSCHSILECCVTFSGVKLSIRSFVLFLYNTIHTHVYTGEPPNIQNIRLTGVPVVK